MVRGTWKKSNGVACALAAINGNLCAISELQYLLLEDAILPVINLNHGPGYFLYLLLPCKGRCA